MQAHFPRRLQGKRDQRKHQGEADCCYANPQHLVAECARFSIASSSFPSVSFSTYGRFFGVDLALLLRSLSDPGDRFSLSSHE